MALSPFAPTSYYRFSNTKFPNTGISTGYRNENNPPHVGLTPYGSRSSENWQIYRQKNSSGHYVYFLRNYDYGAQLQLGLSESHRAVPQLLPKSGELGQQWSVIQDVQGRWVLTNGLLGNGSVLGVSGGGDSGRYTRDVPAMQPTRDGSEHWSITINVSAGEISGEGLLDVEGLEMLLPTASPTPTPYIRSGTHVGKSSADVWNSLFGISVLLIMLMVILSSISSIRRTCTNRDGRGDQKVVVKDAEYEDEGGKGEEGLPVYVEKDDEQKLAETC